MRPNSVERVHVSPTELQNLPRPRNETSPQSMLAVFDDIWIKLLMLAKQLRDIMQSYNEKKQALGWELEVNVLHTKFKSIDETYYASRTAAIGSIISGVATIGMSIGGKAMAENSKGLWSKVIAESMSYGSKSTGTTIEGISKWCSSSETRDADQERAIADLQDKGAYSYAKTLNETLDKARDIMQQMMSMGRSLIDMLSEILRALSK